MGIHGARMQPSPADSPRISLLVVDDHAMVRMGLKAMLGLEPDFEVIAEAEDAEEAVLRYREHRPDIVLLDLRMPGGSGVVVVRRILKEFPAARLIMLTSFDLEEEVFQSLDAGAMGYVLKSVERGELNEAIRLVHGGGRWVPPAIERRLLERAQSQSLSTRELEVLEHLRRGHSSRDIARPWASASTPRRTTPGRCCGSLGWPTGRRRWRRDSSAACCIRGREAGCSLRHGDAGADGGALAGACFRL